MKTLLCFIGLNLSGCALFAQVKPQPVVISCLRQVVRSEEHDDTLHRIVNIFSGFVGDALKKNYPAKVSEVIITLSVKNDTLMLTCLATLVKCSPKESMYYFEHRGACKVLPDDFEVRDAARKIAEKQADEFLVKNPTWEVRFREHTQPVKAGNNYWVVYEDFLAAPKQ